MGKSDKKSRDPSINSSPQYAEDSDHEGDFRGAQEQNDSEDSEGPGFSQWIDEDEEITEPPTVSVYYDCFTFNFTDAWI